MTTFDPTTYSLAIALLAAAVVLASVALLYRALRVDPVALFRSTWTGHTW